MILLILGEWYRVCGTHWWHKKVIHMLLKTPRILISRHGIYYYRYIDRNKRQRKISLRTRDPATAKKLGALLNVQLQLNRSGEKLKVEIFHDEH
jgi:hypothetical protein